MWTLFACEAEPSWLSAEDVAVAASVVNDAIVFGLLDGQNVDGPTSGTETLRIEPPEPDIEDWDDEWEGEIVVDVTWEGDPEGACACRLDCASSKWSFVAGIDAIVEENHDLTICQRSDDTETSGRIHPTRFTGDLSGTGGLGRHLEDPACPADWPDNFASGALAADGRSFDIAAHDDPGDISVTVDGETFAWSYYCGS